MIDKKRGEEFGIYACFLYFIHKGGEGFMFMHICFVLHIGEKEFALFYACLACLSPYICIHVYVLHCIFICLLLCMS